MSRSILAAVRETYARMGEIFGTDGPDTLAARADGDRVFGLGGNDILSSAFNRTTLDGGAGGDRLTTELVVPSVDE